MKTILSIFVLILTINGYSQKKDIKKPEYIIIINDTLSSKKVIETLGSKGYIKSMNKGVSESQRNTYYQRFGNVIGEKEFIIEITTYTEEEKNQKDKATINKPKVDKSTVANDFLVNIRDIAPNFSIKMIDGKTINLEDLKGKVIMLNYWATWCAPCLMEFYDIPSKILEPFGDKEFVLIPIAIGENEDKVKRKMTQLKQKGIDFNVAADPNNEVWKLYATGTIPKNIIIDKEGKIHFMISGGGEKNIGVIADKIKKIL